MNFFNFFNYKTKNIYLWLHDLEILATVDHKWMSNEEQIILLTECANELNGIICLTKWHENFIREKYPMLNNVPYHIIGNGIDLSTFPEKSNKIKHRFYWSSRPERGLDRLLSMIPSLRKRLPDAELYVSTYTSSEVRDRKFYTPPEKILKLKENIESIEGCYYLGSLPQEELHKEMMKSDVWLYPTDFKETYCITALEMMACNVLCVCSDLAGLTETIGDRGVLFDPNSTDEEILNILISALEKSDEYKKRGYDWVIDKTWKNRSEEWLNIINK